MYCRFEIFESARHFRIDFESGGPIRIRIRTSDSNSNRISIEASRVYLRGLTGKKTVKNLCIRIGIREHQNLMWLE